MEIGWRKAFACPAKQTRSPFSQRAPAAARLPSGQGNLLCRRGESRRVDDVRAGTRATDSSLFAEYCFISPCRGCCCFLSAPWCPPAHVPGLATGFAPELECSSIGRLCLALVSCTALIAISYFLLVPMYLPFWVSSMFLCCFNNFQRVPLFSILWMVSSLCSLWSLITHFSLVIPE